MSFRSSLSSYFSRHPDVGAFLKKLEKDNVGFLASALSWSLLTSVVPVVVGLLAIGGFLLRRKDVYDSMVGHLSEALQGVIPRADIVVMVRATTQHAGLLSILGIVGIVWGGANVGGAVATIFQPIFQVRGRSWLRQKAIDVLMIIIFTSLLIVIVGATFAAAFLGQLVSSFPLSGLAQVAFGVIIGVAAAFLLFASIYVVFPNTDPRLTLRHVWMGAGIAAVLFQFLTFVFPLYVTVSRFSRYSALIFALLVLTAWLYLFSVILILGAECVAFGAIRQAQREKKPIGPPPDGTVPQHQDPVRS